MVFALLTHHRCILLFVQEEEKEEGPRVVSIDPAKHVSLALRSSFSSGRSSNGGSSRKVCSAENAIPPRWVGHDNAITVAVFVKV